MGDTLSCWLVPLWRIGHALEGSVRHVRPHRVFGFGPAARRQRESTGPTLRHLAQDRVRVAFPRTRRGVGFESLPQAEHLAGTDDRRGGRTRAEDPRAAPGVGRPQAPRDPETIARRRSAVGQHHHRDPAAPRSARRTPGRPIPRLATLRTPRSQRSLADGFQRSLRVGRRPALPSAHRARRPFALLLGLGRLRRRADRDRAEGVAANLRPLRPARENAHG